MILVIKEVMAEPYWDIQCSTKLWNASIIHAKGGRGVASNMLIRKCYLPLDEEATNLKTIREMSRCMHAVVDVPSYG